MQCEGKQSSKTACSQQLTSKSTPIGSWASLWCKDERIQCFYKWWKKKQPIYILVAAIYCKQGDRGCWCEPHRQEYALGRSQSKVRVSKWPNVHVLGRWQETGVPGGDPDFSWLKHLEHHGLSFPCPKNQAEAHSSADKGSSWPQHVYHKLYEAASQGENNWDISNLHHFWRSTTFMSHCCKQMRNQQRPWAWVTLVD